MRPKKKRARSVSHQQGLVAVQLAVVALVETVIGIEETFATETGNGNGTVEMTGDGMIDSAKEIDGTIGIETVQTGIVVIEVEIAITTGTDLTVGMPGDARVQGPDHDLGHPLVCCVVLTWFCKLDTGHPSLNVFSKSN